MRKVALGLVCILLATAAALWGLQRLKPPAAWSFQRLSLPEGEVHSLAGVGATLFLTMETSEGGSSFVSYRSEDGGITWQRLEGLQDCWLFAFSPSFGEDGRAAAAGEEVWISRDRGITWTKLGGLDPPAPVRALDMAADGAIWLATYPLEGRRRVYRWDGSWQLVLEDEKLGGRGQFRQVVALSRDEALLLAGYNPGGGWRTELWRTEDGGESWTVPAGFPEGAGRMVKVDWGLLVGTRDEGILESRDGGASWQPFHSSPQGQVSLRAADGLLAALVRNGRDLWLCELAGDRWERIRKIERDCVSLTVTNGDVIYLAGRPDFLERGVRRR